ncbi:MAG: GLUG motif-containing protein [Chakrabartia sp.]
MAWAAAGDLPASPTYDRTQLSITSGTTAMGITQKNAVASINWASFSIGEGRAVTITQPTASSLLINRVTGATSSQINGSLTANGQVFLINPNGISIGPKGTVNANGFAASTLGVAAGDGAGLYGLSGGRGSPVSVAGTLTGKGSNSYVVLAGGQITVARTARISANNVALAAATAAALRLPNAGAGFGLTSTQSAKGSTIDIAGNISVTNGALVVDAGRLADAAVNVDGVITAFQSKVSITVGTDERAAGLRVGDAPQGTINAPPPGQILFKGPNRSGSTLRLNGYDYTLVWTKADLQKVNDNLGGRYALANDLGFAAGSPFTNAVIGAGQGDADGIGFSGHFNGLGHKLEDIIINGDGKRALVGLFAIVAGSGAPASISNLKVVTITVTGSSNNSKPFSVGGVVGNLKANAVLQNVFVSGAINGSGTSSTGGLAGETSGLIDHSSADVTAQVISSTSGVARFVGGLVGYAYATSVISNSVARGRILGGVINSAYGDIGVGYVGGIAGGNDGKIIASHVYADVQGGSNIGGVAGTLGSEAKIQSSSFEGTVSAFDLTPSASVGGLVGYSQNGFIADSSAQGTIKALGAGSNIGGLVGYNTGGAITNSHFAGALIAGSASNSSNSISIGGLVGLSFDASLASAAPTRYINNWARVTITGGNYVRAGGLIGDLMTGSVQNSFATGTIQLGQRAIAGGLFGTVFAEDLEAGQSASAEAVISAVRVTVGANSYLGGLAGRNQGTLSNAYATGLLTAGAGSIAGALAGVQGSMGVLKNALYLMGLPGQAALNPVGGSIMGKAGTTQNVKGATDAQLRDPNFTTPILGTAAFEHKKGAYPSVKKRK